jgi:hypothetical protein
MASSKKTPKRKVKNQPPRTRGGGPPIPPRSAAISARFAELRRQHPGKYLAFREEWDGDELREPFVVAVGETLEEVESATAALPTAERARVFIEFLPRVVRVFAPTLFFVQKSE